MSKDRRRFFGLALLGLAMLLVLIYGLVPYVVAEYLGIDVFYGAQRNLVFSLAFACALPLLALVQIDPRDGPISRVPAPIVQWALFAGALVAFVNAPWISDRESFGASVSALFRIAWLTVAFRAAGGTPLTVNVTILQTIALMFVDGSRTYFLVALLPLVMPKRRAGLYLAVGLAAVLFVAAFRDKAVGGSSFLEVATYGLYGEGFNGALGVSQVLESGAKPGVRDVVVAMLQPFFIPDNWVARATGLGVVDSSSTIGGAIAASLGQDYPPMGGFYIASEFIGLGWLGFPLLLAYCLLAYVVTKVIFDRPAFPFGSALFLLAIKASPNNYWKMVVAIGLVGWVIAWLDSKITIRSGPDPEPRKPAEATE
jgi:hypothetical protein